MTAFLIWLLPWFFPQPEVLSIESAVKKDLISCVMVGYYDTIVYSSHYGRCITMEIVAGNRPVRVSYEPGQMLQPVNEGTQNMVLTESGIIALLPFEKRTLQLFAMCGEKYDGGPGNSDTFHFNGLASVDMTGLADLIFEKQYQNHSGQSAMWVLSDDEPLETITGENVEMVMELRKFVAEKKGLQVLKYNPRIIYKVPEVKRLEVVFEADLREPGTGSVILYHPDGTQHSTLIKDRHFPEGRHRLKFYEESTQLKHGAYKVVLVVDGVKRQEEVYFVE